MMILDGTIVNGVVVLDGKPMVPEGARVRVAFDAAEEAYEYPHPLAPYDRQQELALLRQSHEEVLAGETGMPLDQFEAEFRAQFNIKPRG